MTKQEAINRIPELEKELAELKTIASAPDITPEERFWQLMNGCTIYTEKESPDSIFFMKDGEVWFELENSTLWCRWSRVWSVFENPPYNMNYNSIQSLIKDQVEERFKMKGITAYLSFR